MRKCSRCKEYKADTGKTYCDPCRAIVEKNRERRRAAAEAAQERAVSQRKAAGIPQKRLLGDWVFSENKGEKWRAFRGLMCGLRENVTVGIRFPDGVKPSHVTERLQSLGYPRGRDERGVVILPYSNARFSVRKDKTDPRLIWITKSKRDTVSS